jgi:Ca2+-binding RTX toxin-like protein
MGNPSSAYSTWQVSLLDTTQPNYSLINPLIGGDAWGEKSSIIKTVSLTFSFPWENGSNSYFSGAQNDNYTIFSEHEGTNHAAFNTEQKAAATAALQAWANVANLSFTNVVDNATTVGEIRFAFSSDNSLSGVWGHAYYPSDYFPFGGDIWVNYDRASDTDWTKGSANFDSLIHETGHALGLKHPFEDAPILSPQYDSEQFTVMSYTNPPKALWPQVTQTGTNYSAKSRFINPETPMVLDVAAIQYIYGQNTSYKTGDDVYSMDSSSPFFKTIWDAAGSDTIDASSFIYACTIDLNPGSYSSLGFRSNWYDFKHIDWNDPYKDSEIYDGTNNLGIAFDCWIETAVGGSNNDTLTGNKKNNQLKGNSGNDTVMGGAGNDTIDGGAGDDTVIFTGNFADYSSAYSAITKTFTVKDKTVARDDADSIASVEYFKFADVTKSAESLISSSSITNNDKNATLNGGSGNDVITGKGGDDSLSGLSGNDTLNGGEGNDTLIGGRGKDQFIINAGTDIITDLGDGGSDVVIVGAGATANALVTAAWTASANCANSGTASITTAGYAVNLSAVSTGTSGFRVTNKGAATSLTGSARADTLTGGAGNDRLTGGSGLDSLVGAQGADILTGGTNRDTFVFSAGHSGQYKGFDVITDFEKGSTRTGDVIDYSTDLTRGGSAAIATTIRASISDSTAVATFAAKSGAKLTDALDDIATCFTAATDAAGEFAFFKVNNSGSMYLFISDGRAGVTVGDVVVQLAGVASISAIDLTGGNLTIIA